MYYVQRSLDWHHLQFFTHYSNLMNTCVCSNVNYDGLITTKFCRCHYRFAIKACAKNYHDLMVKNWIKIIILFPLVLNFEWKIMSEMCLRSIMESSGPSLISLMDCIYLITLIFNPSSTGTHFTKGLSAHNSNLVKILVALIKSPQYTGGDFMFLYRFVRRRRRRRRPQIIVHAITFEQLFGFLSFLAQLLALTCRLPD